MFIFDLVCSEVKKIGELILLCPMEATNRDESLNNAPISSSSTQENEIIGEDGLTDKKRQEQFNANMQLQEDIAQSIRDSQPLVGEIESLIVLSNEYQENPNPAFIVGITELSDLYKGIRRVRGDGNCFYRAFLYCYLSNLQHLIKAGGDGAFLAEQERERFLNQLDVCKIDITTKGGYDEMVIEDPYECLRGIVESVPNTSPEQLHATFNESGGNAEYAVWFLRVLVGCFLKTHAEEYTGFLFSSETFCEGMDMTTFVQREVEPMGRECEQIQIMALMNSFNLGVSIEYLGPEGRSKVTLPEDFQSNFPINLLYRPGHYDILVETMF